MRASAFETVDVGDVGDVREAGLIHPEIGESLGSTVTLERSPSRNGGFVSGLRRRELGALSLLLFGACGGVSSQPARPHNLILIVVDSLRIDHLGMHGAARDTSPRLDALARGGARFERAYAPAPWTKPTMASLFTGLYPTAHSVTEYGLRVPLELETLAERLLARGYNTAGVVSNKLLIERHHFTQGFQSYDPQHAQGHKYVSSPGVTESALRYLAELAQKPEPFFLFVHYFDPHYRYLDHESVDFAPPTAGRLTGERGIQELRELLDSMTAEEVAYLEARYDEEIRITDDGIGALLDRLDDLGEIERTVVAFTADHGEEFLAHGWLGHTRTLYEELVRVPLLLRGPGIAIDRKVDDLVSLVSLPGTLLELVGVENSSAPFPGGEFAHLVRASSGKGPLPEHAFAEVEVYDRKSVMKSAHKKAVIGSRWKCIRDETTGKVELFDLEADPTETSDVAHLHPDRVDELLGVLDRHFAALLESRTEPSETELTAEDIEDLVKLGYAGESKQ